MELGSFNFFIPTQVKCGMNISTKTGEVLKPFNPNRILVVTDPGIRRANLLKHVENSIRAQNIDYKIFDQVEPNPCAETIHRGVKILKESNCDLVLAVGGGSSIDTAKGVAAIATNPGHILDYTGSNKIKYHPLPLVVIPTTAGTGSEGTNVTVVTNKETSFKTPIISPYLFPKLAILDPDLTINLPQEITASTGMDALTHGIESYISKSSSSVSEAFAIRSVKIIGENLPTAYFVGTDVASREKMLTASFMAGVAFAQSRLGNVHAISHTLGGVFNIPHGIANATLLPFVMKFNLPACPHKMRDIAMALGKDVTGLSLMEAGEKAIEAVQEMNHNFKIPNNIKDLGVSLDQLQKLIEDSMASGNVMINPRLTSAKDIQVIIENAYNGISD